MAKTSKNARTGSKTDRHYSDCCSALINTRSIFEHGKMRNIAECSQCKRTARRVKDLK